MSFYIVLRNKRVADPTVFSDKTEAFNRARSLSAIHSLSNKQSDKFTVLKTTNPHIFL